MSRNDVKFKCFFPKQIQYMKGDIHLWGGIL